MILESLLAGLGAGTLGAMLGLGGGVLLVPILTLVVGLPLIEAIPASLVGVIATAMGGTGKFLRDGHTDSALAVRAAGLAMLGAMVGARVAVRTPTAALEIAFAVLLLAIVARMLRGGGREAALSQQPSPWIAGGLFTGAGLVAGLLGVGGGVLNVPAIHLALRRPMVQAVATSTMMIAFTAGAGAAAYAAANMVNWPVAAACATGAFFGGRLGAFLSPRIPRRKLQLLFTLVLMYVAVEMGARGLGVPWWR